MGFYAIHRGGRPALRSCRYVGQGRMTGIVEFDFPAGCAGLAHAEAIYSLHGTVDTMSGCNGN
jgi:hypothetical protein